MTSPPEKEKAAEAYRTIGEVAAAVGEPTHVLRFWETKVPQIRPALRAKGRRRSKRGAQRASQPAPPALNPARVNEKNGVSGR